MPELPEVETTVRLIRSGLEGRRILGGAVAWVRSLGGQGHRAFFRAVTGASIRRVWRRGKYIVLDLERTGNQAGQLLIHLRMTGRIFVNPPPAGLQTHVRVRLDLDVGALHFVDVRKFGRVQFVEDAEAVLGKLGPEPLEAGFSANWLAGALRSRRRLLKPLLLDQSFIAGLGNIYVDETLHRARLHPLRSSHQVRNPAARRLREAICTTLAEAIAREGSSFDSFYRTPEGNPGRFQDQFLVYGRQGQPCLTCGRAVQKIQVAQRGTHLCPRCQRAPR